MKLVIPTYQRENNQTCFARLPDFVKEDTILFTHSGRAKYLRKKQPDAHVYNMGKCDGIADVRQNVVEHCELMGIEKIFMCDDQCYFNWRNEDLKLKVMPAEDTENWQRMLSQISGMLDTYPMVGVSPRPGNNRVEQDFKIATRAYSCYGLNLPMLREHNLTFDGMYREDSNIKLYEDFYLLLSMLTKGIPNAVIYNFAMYHTHGKPGGNSLFRNQETQRVCIQALVDRFPGIVKLVKKSVKTWNIGDDDFRWDCNVQWKKAYEQGLRENLL